MTQTSGELYDLGYQHYEGPREGRMRARKAVFVDGIRTILGLGHGALAKVLPILLFGAAVAPAVILSVIASLTGGAFNLPGHDDYYKLISVVLIIFSAIMAPELLCPDRRNGVISLYLVRPLTIADYLAGRWLAFFTITLSLVYAGQMVLLAGTVLGAAEPMDYLRENWLDIPRILAAGLLLAAFITTVPLTVAAFTTRRAYATAIVIGLFIISAAAAGLLTSCDNHGGRRQSSDGARQCEPVTGDLAKWIGLVDLGGVPGNLNNMIFGTEDEGDRERLIAELPRIVPIGWYVVLTGGLALVLWRRYERLSV